MSYNNSIPVDASKDLSGLEYHACQASGDVAGTLALAIGILQNKPQNGEDASLVYAGRTKMQSGGAITAGAMLTVAASGFVQPELRLALAELRWCGPGRRRAACRAVGGRRCP